LPVSDYLNNYMELEELLPQMYRRDYHLEYRVRKIE